MAMTQNDIAVIGVTRVLVGLSSIIRVVPGPQQAIAWVKIAAGGGTLEMVQGTTAGGAGWGAGYPLGGSEVLQVNGPAVMYFAATGATMTVGLLIGRTAGATVI